MGILYSLSGAYRGAGPCLHWTLPEVKSRSLHSSGTFCLFCLIFYFTLTEPGNMRVVGIGAADRDSLNINSFGSA